MSKKILVVGAGFAGAVYARELAESGYQIDVIDQRSHIAGNAYDEVFPTGVRVHRYGPHIFHTNNQSIVEWLFKFSEFVLYEHKVTALLDNGKHTPLPINRTTINTVFDLDLKTPEEVKNFLAQQAVPIAEPKNAAEHLWSVIGVKLTDIYFRPYTKKMWGFDLEDMDASIVKRIPLRFDDEERYFPDDKYQYLPKEGYTKLIENIFSHENISIILNTKFEKSMLDKYEYCFNSMPIDVYFDEIYGPLPYRSIKFTHYEFNDSYRSGPQSVVNFTDDGEFTRESDWSQFALHRVFETGKKTVSRESPCDYKDNDFERYYPVKTSDGRYDVAYKRYKALADHLDKLSFIGRCGTYQYLNMDQVINQSLMGVRAWISQNK